MRLSLPTRFGDKGKADHVTRASNIKVVAGFVTIQLWAGSLNSHESSYEQGRNTPYVVDEAEAGG
jgi:hypothetical protein